MKTPDIPENEQERLRSLECLKLLDTPISERFERITRMVCRTLNVPIAAVSLVDRERQWFKSIQGLHVDETSRDIAFCAHAINDEEPFVVSDARADARFHDNPLVTADPNIRSYAGIPLAVENGLRLGTLCAIDTSPRDFTPEQLEILSDLAGMATAELMSVKLSEAHVLLVAELEQAQRAALIDSLTRLWNRGGAELLLEKEWEAAKRTNTPITVALLDIDHFKKVNDQLGHAAGDEVLRGIAKTVLQHLRPVDTVARWGGEEFLMVLPDCAGEDAAIALERVLTYIRQEEFNGIRVTASIGACSCHPTEAKRPASIIDPADRSLYRAKVDGRDRIVFDSEPG